MPPVLAFIPEVLGALVPEALGAGLGAGAAELGAGALAGGAGEAFAAGTAADLAGAGLASGAGLGTALETTAALGPLGGASELGGIAGFGTGLGEAAAGAAPLAFTVNALPGAAGAGLGLGDLATGAALGAGLGGLGALESPAFGSTFQPPPGTNLTPAQTVANRLPTLPELGFASSGPVSGSGGGSALSAAAPDTGAAPSFGPAGSQEPPFLPSGARNVAAYPLDSFEKSLISSQAGSGGGIMDFLGKNPGLAATLGIGALGTVLGPKLAPLLSGKVPQQPGLENLRAQEAALAGQQQAYGQQLQQPLVTGQLPAGAEQAVKNAIHDATVATKARYANLGLSGSTMEQDALNNIQNQATAQRFAIAEQMAQTGLSATSQAAGALGLQDQIYTQLMQAQISQDQALQSAIARFAGAAALGTGLAASRTG